jgi:hypothetical protein
MANSQILNLPAATAFTGSEQLEIGQAGTLRRTTTSQVAGLYPGPIGVTGPTGAASTVIVPSGSTWSII